MKATQQLRAEHEGIQLMLRISEAICRKLEAGERVNPDHMEGIIEFFRVFVDHCHQHFTTRIAPRPQILPTG